MKKSYLFLCMLACGVLLSAPVANAYSVTFGDDSIYWPGWNNGTGDDGKDTIGIPNLLGGLAEFNSGGLLTSLTFNVAPTNSTYWNVLSPGDLFIDLGTDETWDYVVKLASWPTAGAGTPDAAAGDYNISSVALGLNAGSGYILSGKDNTNGWKGYSIRDDHAVAWDGKTGLIGSYGAVGFSGWGDTYLADYTFDFTSLLGGGLNVGNDFTVGWTPNCGNDVLYEGITNPVPEPATMLLLGFGLIGLAGVGRKSLVRT